MNRTILRIALVFILIVGLSGALISCAGHSKKTTEEETHKHSEKGLTPEHKTVEPPICPACKNVRVRPIEGKTLATMPMVCLDCKNEISEVAVHHCDKCGKDVLACVMCQKTSAELKAAIKEAECPKCKEVRVRPIKGKTLAKLEMKCPDCKHKSQEWLVQHCDTCDADFISCPICKRAAEMESLMELLERSLP